MDRKPQSGSSDLGNPHVCVSPFRELLFEMYEAEGLLAVNVDQLFRLFDSMHVGHRCLVVMVFGLLF